MSTSQRVVMLCGCGVKAGIVRMWVAGKTVLTWAISEHFRDEVLYNTNRPYFAFYLFYSVVVVYLSLLLFLLHYCYVHRTYFSVRTSGASCRWSRQRSMTSTAGGKRSWLTWTRWRTSTVALISKVCSAAAFTWLPVYKRSYENF